METSQEKIAHLQELLRQAYAIVNELGYVPNVRAEVEHHQNLALLADHPKPQPLPAIGPPLVASEPPSEDE